MVYAEKVFGEVGWDGKRGRQFGELMIYDGIAHLSISPPFNPISLPTPFCTSISS